MESVSNNSKVFLYETSVVVASGSIGANFSRSKRQGRPSNVAVSIASHHFCNVNLPVGYIKMEKIKKYYNHHL